MRTAAVGVHAPNGLSFSIAELTKPTTLVLNESALDQWCATNVV
jgi:hypothetical protein